MLRRQPDAVMLRQLLMHYYAISHYAIRDSGYLHRPTVAVFWYLWTVKWILIYYDVFFLYLLYIDVQGYVYMAISASACSFS